jgi:hypothetical protein
MEYIDGREAALNGCIEAGEEEFSNLPQSEQEILDFFA